MKSPHTLIQLHERAIRMQEMIRTCERLSEVHIVNALTFKNSLPLIYKHYTEQSERYRCISNYLQTRYISLLKQLN